MIMNYVSGGADKIAVEYAEGEKPLNVNDEFKFNGLIYIVKFKQASKFLNKEVLVAKRKRD